MGTDLSNLTVYVGFVSFSKGTDILNVLSAEAEGVVGWMGGKAQNLEQFVELLRVELEQIGLSLIEVDKIEILSETDEVAEFDEHLAANMSYWESGKMTVWGTIHQYLGEGEA